ncbi:MAG: cellulase family glycosylhydrolase [Treponema sp.]|jgi:hypothetical protein|nr:cellulase family glycosylhydrolase [Treponema sp.]
MSLRRIKCGILTFLPLVVLFSCSSFAPSRPRIVPEDFFGISPDRSPLEREDFELLDRFGAVWIRTTIRWSNLEPQEGVWLFEGRDAYVEKTRAAGKKLVYILGFDSKWLYGDHREHRNLGERELPYFLKYVEQVAGHFRGKVAAYEIWNEPNWVFWKGSDRRFFTLAAAAVKKIRETDPNAVILAGSTSRFDRSFTRGMFKSGAMEYTDGFSIHPYGINPRDTMRQIDRLRKVLDEYGYSKPVWVTEVGYATGGISFVRLNRYPEYIVKTLSGLAAREVRNLIWYEFMDEFNQGEEPDHWNFEHFFGLIYPDRTLKPGAEAFMLTSRHLAGSEYRPELPLREGVSRRVTSLCFRKKDGTAILLLWQDGAGKRKLRLYFEGEAAAHRRSIYGGEDIPLPAKTVLEIGRDPVFITWTGEGVPRLEKYTR